MLDTNLINVENIKATVVKIKEWVQELYPFSYIGGNFNIYNNKNKDHTILNSAGDGNLNIWSQFFGIKSVVTMLKAPLVSLNSSSSSIKLDSNKAKIIGNDSATVGYDDGTSKCSYAKVSKADGISILNARQDAEYKDSHGNTLTFKDGDIILKDADDSDGCLYLGVDKSLVKQENKMPYAIYNGRLPNGYVNSGNGTGQYLYSSTSFGGWTATGTFLVERDLYSGGTYIITASLKSDEALGMVRESQLRFIWKLVKALESINRLRHLNRL